MTDYAKQVRENVASHGFHVTYVSCDDQPSFCYSTGIFETHSIPELFLSSLPPNLSHELISQYIKRHCEDGPTIGRRIKAREERFDYYLISISMKSLAEYALASFKFYGDTPFECLQLVYPDPSLLFPNDDGYDYDQELLGVFCPEG